MKFESFFKREGRAKKFYPVIHVIDMEQTEVNAKVAFENGADGIFLIKHRLSSGRLLMIASVLRGKWSKHFIGINLLDKEAPNAFDLGSREDRNLNALWVDDSSIGDHIWSFADRLYKKMKRSTWDGYYFTSVAFKYQPSVKDVSVSARNAVPFSHVVVTSGDETGSPLTVEKIRIMKEAIGDHPLAIASGMTCKNIHQFLPYTDIFIVSTGISDKNNNLDARLVDQMATIIKNYNKSSGLL
ncbi:MAG: hypothetical protein AUK16_03210 [Parcubacteria group bacterium CG2_30_44_11]|nr:MAG: hypothetical protein AUK16_03210 [Parcubacteria group bacterium CG2_30_44_11]